MNGLQANHTANAHSRKRAAEAEAIAEKDAAVAKAIVDKEAHTLERIDTITRNARGIWFGLLGALVFAGVTLLGVEDIDFFGVDRNTKLPLIGVSVPVTYFFAAGAALVTAFYVYFHLYLVQLWDALGAAPARPNDRALSKTVHPWLVSDAMIRWRGWLRRKNADEPLCTDERPLALIGGLVSFIFVWLFGLAVLGYFWWKSMPAHQEWMTLGLGALLVFAFWVAARSLGSAYAHMRGKTRTGFWRYLWQLTRVAVFLCVLVIIASLSWLRTEGGFDEYAIWWDDFSHNESKKTSRYETIENKIQKDQIRRMHLKVIRKKYAFNDFLVSATLNEEYITVLPEGWQPREHAEKWFREKWCKREGIEVVIMTDGDSPKSKPCANLSSEQEKGFTEEWQIRRATYLDNLSHPSLQNRDLRKARLTEAFLPGVDLRKTRLYGAILKRARLEGADFRHANLRESKLNGAMLEGADLRYANFEKVDFKDVNLEGADIRFATLNGVSFEQTNLAGGDLSGSSLEGAVFRKANLDGVIISGAHLLGGIIWQTPLDGINLGGIRLKGTLIAGRIDRPTTMKLTDFSGVSFMDMAFKSVDFTGATSVNNNSLLMAFADKSVIVPIGFNRPCHWAIRNLSSNISIVWKKPRKRDPFIGRWRGWVEHNGGTWPISDFFTDFKDVKAIEPKYKTGPKTGKLCPTIAEMEAN